MVLNGKAPGEGGFGEFGGEPLGLFASRCVDGGGDTGGLIAGGIEVEEFGETGDGEVEPALAEAGEGEGVIQMGGEVVGFFAFVAVVVAGDHIKRNFAEGGAVGEEELFDPVAVFLAGLAEGAVDVIADGEDEADFIALGAEAEAEALNAAGAPIADDEEDEALRLAGPVAEIAGENGGSVLEDLIGVGGIGLEVGDGEERGRGGERLALDFDGDGAEAGTGATDGVAGWGGVTPDEGGRGVGESTDVDEGGGEEEKHYSDSPRMR